MWWGKSSLGPILLYVENTLFVPFVCVLAFMCISMCLCVLVYLVCSLVSVGVIVSVCPFVVMCVFVCVLVSLCVSSKMAAIVFTHIWRRQRLLISIRGFPQTIVSAKFTPCLLQDVIITHGCDGALDLAMSALANPGQNILIPEISYRLYALTAKYLGCEVRRYALMVSSFNCFLTFYKVVSVFVSLS